MHPEPGEVSPVGGAVDRLRTHRCHHRTRWSLLISPNVAKYGKKKLKFPGYKRCADTLLHSVGSVLVQSLTDGMKIQVDVKGTCFVFRLHVIKKMKNTDRQRARERENTTTRRHSSFILINRSSAKRSHAYRRLTI